METRVELTILHPYVKNQVILGPILLYRASKCKQTKEQRSLLFTFLFNYYHFFIFFQDANIPGRAIKRCNQSRKHKSALFQILKKMINLVPSREPNQQIIDSCRLFCQELPTHHFRKRHLSTIEVAKSVVHVLLGFKTVC